MNRVVFAAALTAGLAGTAFGADIELTLLRQLNVSGAVASTNPERIGSNVSAVAWNGSKLYIGGFNQSGAAISTGIAEISDPLGAATIGPRFGGLSTPNLRGFSGLAIQGNRLAAGCDTGAAVAGGYATFDTGSNASVASKNLRGFTGPAFDPGFAGSAPSAGNVAFSGTGSGRRGVFNTDTGADIYALGAGMIWNSNPAGASPAPGTNNRDLAFDPTSGDIYGRSANAIIKGVRSGDNSISNAGGTAIFVNYGAGGQGTAANTNQQNLAFMDLGSFGRFLVFNDRPTSVSAGFTSAVKVIDTNGVAQTVGFNGFNVTSSTSAFDFSFDAASRTLAVSDFSNSNVYIFSVVPAPSALALMGLGGLVAGRRRR
ncbi:MAG: PEP-CTERM sorting domain-containing protein [Phycisphaerales bacterium]